MGKAKAYSISEQVFFCIFDQNGVNPTKANPLLEKLKKALTEFRLDRGQVIGSVAVCDELECSQENANLVLGSYRIRLEIVDHNRDGEAAERWNNQIPGWICQDLCKIFFAKHETILKVVLDHDNLGDLSIPDTPKITDEQAKKIFYGRFAKSIFNFPFLGRLLILEKEQKRVKTDGTISNELREKLLKDLNRYAIDCKRNMKKDELEEYVYHSESLGLIPSI